jgi:hypothetical protein
MHKFIGDKLYESLVSLKIATARGPHVKLNSVYPTGHAYIQVESGYYSFIKKHLFYLI